MMMDVSAMIKTAKALAFPIAVSGVIGVTVPTTSVAAPDGTLGTAILSASINADGTILRGEGVTASGTQRLSPGQYEVGFIRDITACVYSVSVGEGIVGSASPSVTGVTRRSGNPNGVFVQVRNPPDEALEDKAFFVLVYCGR